MKKVSKILLTSFIGIGVVATSIGLGIGLGNKSYSNSKESNFKIESNFNTKLGSNDKNKLEKYNENLNKDLENVKKDYVELKKLFNNLNEKADKTELLKIAKELSEIEKKIGINSNIDINVLTKLNDDNEKLKELLNTKLNDVNRIYEEKINTLNDASINIQNIINNFNTSTESKETKLNEVLLKVETYNTNLSNSIENINNKHTLINNILEEVKATKISIDETVNRLESLVNQPLPDSVLKNDNGDINANNNKISNISDPENDKDAANKKYVDDRLRELEERINNRPTPETLNERISLTSAIEDEIEKIIIREENIKEYYKAQLETKKTKIKNTNSNQELEDLKEEVTFLNSEINTPYKEVKDAMQNEEVVNTMLSRFIEKQQFESQLPNLKTDEPLENKKQIISNQLKPKIVDLKTSKDIIEEKIVPNKITLNSGYINNNNLNSLNTLNRNTQFGEWWLKVNPLYERLRDLEVKINEVFNNNTSKFNIYFPFASDYLAFKNNTETFKTKELDGTDQKTKEHFTNALKSFYYKFSLLVNPQYIKEKINLFDFNDIIYDKPIYQKIIEFISDPIKKETILKIENTNNSWIENRISEGNVPILYNKLELQQIRVNQYSLNGFLITNSIINWNNIYNKTSLYKYITIFFNDYETIKSTSYLNLINNKKELYKKWNLNNVIIDYLNAFNINEPSVYSKLERLNDVWKNIYLLYELKYLNNNQWFKNHHLSIYNELNDLINQIDSRVNFIDNTHTLTNEEINNINQWIDNNLNNIKEINLERKNIINNIFNIKNNIEELKSLYQKSISNISTNSYYNNNIYIDMFEKLPKLEKDFNRDVNEIINSLWDLETQDLKIKYYNLKNNYISNIENIMNWIDTYTFDLENYNDEQKVLIETVLVRSHILFDSSWNYELKNKMILTSDIKNIISKINNNKNVLLHNLNNEELKTLFKLRISIGLLFSRDNYNENFLNSKIVDNNLKSDYIFTYWNNIFRTDLLEYSNIKNPNNQLFIKLFFNNDIEEFKSYLNNHNYEYNSNNTYFKYDNKISENININSWYLNNSNNEEIIQYINTNLIDIFKNPNNHKQKILEIFNDYMINEYKQYLKRNIDSFKSKKRNELTIYKNTRLSTSNDNIKKWFEFYENQNLIDSMDLEEIKKVVLGFIDLEHLV